MFYTRCRLCLESVGDKCFVLIGDFERNMLETLVPLVKLDISTKPKMCEKCANFLETSYQLKAMWLENNERIKGLLLQDSIDSSTTVSCCLCGQGIMGSTSEKETIKCNQMIAECIPELDIYCAANVSVCEQCVCDLARVYLFIGNTSQVEEKIKDLYGTMHSVPECEKEEKISVNEYEEPDKFVIESVTEVMRSDGSEKRNMIHTTKVDFKGKVVTSDVEWTTDVKQNVGNRISVSREVKPSGAVSNFEDCFIKFVEEAVAAQKGALKIALERSRKGTKQKRQISPHKSEERVTVDSEIVKKERMQENATVHKCKFCAFTTTTEEVFEEHMTGHSTAVTPQNGPFLTAMDRTRNGTKRKAPLISCKTENVADISIKNEEPIKEEILHECKLCLFTTVNEELLEKHLLQHSMGRVEALLGPDGFKCELCPYTTKRKGNLRSHSLVHKDITETTMYKCSDCDFTTKHKISLKTHVTLKHAKASETTFFACNMCGFRTRLKGNLKLHMVIHMDPERMVMYKCEWCSFETKHKMSLRTHRLKHKEFAEGVLNQTV